MLLNEARKSADADGLVPVLETAWNRLRADKRTKLKKRKADPQFEKKESARKRIGQKGTDLYRLLFVQKQTKLSVNGVIDVAANFDPPIVMTKEQAQEVVEQIAFTKPKFSEPMSGVMAYAFPEFVAETGVKLWQNAIERLKKTKQNNKLLAAQYTTERIPMDRYPMSSHLTSSFLRKTEEEKEVEEEEDEGEDAGEGEGENEGENDGENEGENAGEAADSVDVVA